MPGGQFLELLLLKWSDFDNSKIAAGYFTHNYGLDPIIFWELLVEDDTPDKANKTLYKFEATITSQRQKRTLEYLLYNPQGKETFRNKRSGSFSPVQKNSPADQCIDFALKHAKEGKDTGEIPVLP